MNASRLIAAAGGLSLVLASSGCATLVGAGIGLGTSHPERDVAVSQVRALRPGVRVTVTLRNDSVTSGEYRGYLEGSSGLRQEPPARSVSSTLIEPPPPVAGARIMIRNEAGDHSFDMDQVRTVRLPRVNNVAKGATIGLVVDVVIGFVYLAAQGFEMFPRNGAIWK